MALANLDAGNLKAVDFGGVINEDVMQTIWDISRIPLPFTDLIGGGSIGNDEYSWVIDELEPPVADQWTVDGADSDQQDTKTGRRVSNDAGIKHKEVRVSSRADASDTIGYANELANQVMRRQQELRRDFEAAYMGIQGNQHSDPDSDVPGILAGFCCMAAKQDTGSGGSGGTYAAGLWTPWTPGTRTPLTETLVRDAAQAAFEDGGNPTVLMSVPAMIRGFSEYMFTSSSRIATLTAETNGQAPGRAMGTVNVFLSDFGSELRMSANRLQLTYPDVSTTDAACSVMLIDPAYVDAPTLRGYRVERLAKTGLSEKRMMSADMGLRVKEPRAHRVLNDINPTAPVTYQ